MAREPESAREPVASGAPPEDVDSPEFELWAREYLAWPAGPDQWRGPVPPEVYRYLD